MNAIRFAVPVAFVAAILVCACFSHPLFGGGPSYSYTGVANPSAPILHDEDTDHPLFRHRGDEAGIPPDETPHVEAMMDAAAGVLEAVTR